MAKFCPMFSGSGGNCTYISGTDGGILIDAGVSAKKIEGALAENSVAAKDIRAIFVTHEHTDHVSGVRVFATRYNIPVYLTEGTLEGLKQRGFFCDKVDYRILEEKTQSAGLCVRSFETEHDVNESCGFVVSSENWKMAVCTDLGVITDTVRQAITGCDLVMLESNHDSEMLKNGIYTYQLKRRIMGESGHLSNNICAQELVRLCKSGTTRFVLAHLSRENNTPKLARDAALSALSAAGLRENIDYYLQVALPQGNAPMFL